MKLAELSPRPVESGKLERCFLSRPPDHHRNQHVDRNKNPNLNLSAPRAATRKELESELELYPLDRRAGEGISSKESGESNDST